MSKIEVQFEFELGDLVYFRGSANDGGQRPTAFVIVEQIAQKCSGGVQQLYKLSGETSYHSELALTKDEPPYRPMPEGAIHDRQRVVEAERQGYTKPR